MILGGDIMRQLELGVGTEIPPPQPPGRTTAGGKVPEYATYYPSLMNCIPVGIYGVTANASHDFMANCHENRHFLDVALWKELKEKNPHLGEAIAPHPPCKRLQGTRVEGGNVVIGMLKNHVKVTLLKAKKDTEGRKIQRGQGVEIMLKNVLLVHNLPVPLHISTKADRSILNTSAFDYNPKKHVPRAAMNEDNFPERYRDHSYWVKRQGNPIVNIMNPDEMEELSEGLDRCMEEGDGKAARNELAEKCGWRALRVNHSGTESWEHKDTGDRIDYYPMTDRAKTTVKIHPRDEEGEARGNPHNKDLVRDKVGGNRGLAKIFEDVRCHTGTGRYKK